MVKYIFNDEFKTTYTYDKVYVIVGRARNRYHDTNRCIQCDLNSSKPYINTYMGYRINKVVVFTTKTHAENFLRNFLKSKRRRMQYAIDWRIIEYKPSSFKSCILEYTLKEKFDDDYGWFYTLRLDKCEKIPNELVSTSTKEISKPIEIKTNLSILEDKLAELDGLVLDVKSLIEDSKEEEVLSQQDAIAKVKDLIMKYDIRVSDIYDDNDYEVINYVSENFYPEDLINIKIEWR